MFILDLVFTNPPQNTTICAGNDINITCGYSYMVPLGAVWIIGGESFSSMDIKESSYLQLPKVNDVSDMVLTVYSVSEQMNETTFQCEFTLLPPVFSPVGTLTVMGKLTHCYETKKSNHENLRFHQLYRS